MSTNTPKLKLLLRLLRVLRGGQPKPKSTAARYLKVAAIVFAGAASAGLCRLLPHPFHVPCELLAKLLAAGG